MKSASKAEGHAEVRAYPCVDSLDVFEGEFELLERGEKEPELDCAGFRPLGMA